MDNNVTFSKNSTGKNRYNRVIRDETFLRPVTCETWIMTKLNWLTWESVILTKPSRDLKILGTETFIIKVTTLTELFPNMDHIANSDGGHSKRREYTYRRQKSCIVLGTNKQVKNWPAKTLALAPRMAEVEAKVKFSVYMLSVYVKNKNNPTTGKLDINVKKLSKHSMCLSIQLFSVL